MTIHPAGLEELGYDLHMHRVIIIEEVRPPRRFK
jgi:hypothetical protein